MMPSATAPLENSGDDVRPRAHGTEPKTEWACNSESVTIMPSASSQSSMQISVQMENNDATKTVLSLLEKKVRNLEKRKVSLAFVWGERSNTILRLDHAMMVWFWHVFLAAELSLLFAGKAWFVQEAGGCWANAEWRSKGALYRGES